MSRFRRAVHNVASWYVVLGATSFYVLASAPLAFHYLSQRQFGLWALMSSISLYLNLIDLGMSNAVARLLIDHKDERASGAYGGLIKTGWLVLLTQGVIVFLAGSALAPFLGRLLKIDADLQADFVALLRWQCATLGLGFALRIFSHILHAFQRIDLVNYTQLAGLILNFASQWWFFRAGQGVFSLAWAGLLAAALGALICVFACWRLRLFPAAGAWGGVSWTHFKGLFDYGKDVFMITLGMQFISASQTLIVARCLGLEAAAAWSVGTRTFSMISQAIWRVLDSATPALAEMIARGEHALLRERFKALVILTASLSGVAAVCFALCNSTFVTWWLHGQVAWSSWNDVLLGISMISVAVLRCHLSLVITTKKMAFLRYLYFIEGAVFLTAALLTAKWGGLPAVIICGILCSVLFSGAYGVWRISLYLDFPIPEMVLDWLAPMARVLTMLIPAALVLWLAIPHVAQAIIPFISALVARLPHQWGMSGRVLAALSFTLDSLLSGALGLWLFLRFGLPRSVQRELLERSPKNLNPILKRVFAPSPI